MQGSGYEAIVPLTNGNKGYGNRGSMQSSMGQVSSMKANVGASALRTDAPGGWSVAHDAIATSKMAFTLLEVFCRKAATNNVVSSVTTILTIYALFGDDLRLMLTDKMADAYFDLVTGITMAVFGMEIVILSIGKGGYLFGFFFWLDIISTVTLVLDITTLNEELFGDQISKAGRDASKNAGNAQAGESAEAARAARMSRAGTKAGRVVRLIRIVRLLRLVKSVRPNKSASYDDAGPSDMYEDDEDNRIEKESAVSKKLSEMTTRRVIALVLVIMLMLPLFQTDYWGDELPTSSQYGVNNVYRSWWDGVYRFSPWSNNTALDSYLNSFERKVYENTFLQYVYYHNWFCPAELPNGKDPSQCPSKSFGRLFWAGAGISVGHKGLDTRQYFMPGRTAVYDWNEKWNGLEWDYYQCDLPLQAQERLRGPWSDSKPCVQGSLRGHSLISWQDSETRVNCPEDLRYQERSVAFPTSASTEELEDMVMMFVFDIRSGSAMAAALNAGQTFFICFLLGFGAMTFSNDANKLVLMPIERMIAKLDKIRKNPLEAMSIGDAAEEREERVAARKNRGAVAVMDAAELHQQLLLGRPTMWKRFTKYVERLRSIGKGRTTVKEPMETVVLEKTIIKIGSLLALGFGEAGAEIIGQNMQGSDSSALNAMIPGRKVEAIFGFCDIRNFTDATEVLQDQVMVFVNRIAGVVHTCISEFFGSPNKNIGDAFLLVWRLSGQKEQDYKRLADMSMVCFIKIIAHINKSPLLAEYRGHPKLVKRLPNYRVRMGFGLHSGWAIEGAIGSEFKIDASYLSPNVNMASRLESVTKQYGCLILLSQALHTLMSEPMAEECRLIDHVLMSGTSVPFEMYTIDLDDLALEVERLPAGKKASDKTYRKRHEIEKLRAEHWAGSHRLHELFQNDMDVVTMRAKFSEEFFCRFNMAYLNYQAGEWEAAKDLLEATRFFLATEDGPSAALMRFLKLQDWTAPKNWAGYRVIG